MDPRGDEASTQAGFPPPAPLRPPTDGNDNPWGVLVAAKGRRSRGSAAARRSRAATPPTRAATTARTRSSLPPSRRPPRPPGRRPPRPPGRRPPASLVVEGSGRLGAEGTAHRGSAPIPTGHRTTGSHRTRATLQSEPSLSLRERTTHCTGHRGPRTPGRRASCIVRPETGRTPAPHPVSFPASARTFRDGDGDGDGHGDGDRRSRIADGDQDRDRDRDGGRRRGRNRGRVPRRRPRPSSHPHPQGSTRDSHPQGSARDSHPQGSAGDRRGVSLR